MKELVHFFELGQKGVRSVCMKTKKKLQHYPFCIQMPESPSLLDRHDGKSNVTYQKVIPL